MQSCVNDICEDTFELVCTNSEDSSRYVVRPSGRTGVDVEQHSPHAGWCETKGLLLRSWCGFRGRCDVRGLEPCIEVIQPIWKRGVTQTYVGALESVMAWTCHRRLRSLLLAKLLVILSSPQARLFLAVFRAAAS